MVVSGIYSEIRAAIYILLAGCAVSSLFAIFSVFDEEPSSNIYITLATNVVVGVACVVRMAFEREMVEIRLERARYYGFIQ